MSTFFSGTDTNTLKEEGSDVNHFVSLIVNNAGTYNAAITRKISVKDNIHREYEYKSFNDEFMSGDRYFEKESEIIEYFYLDIKVEKTEDSSGELLNRISQLREIKKKPAFTPFQTNMVKDYVPYKSSMEAFKPITKEPIQKNLFDNTIIQKEDMLTDWYVKQLLTCNILLPKSNTLSIEEVQEKAPSVIKSRFKDGELYESFMTNFLDFIVYDFTEKLEELHKEPGNPTEAASLLFDKILPLKGSYINTLTDLLEAYI